MSLKELNKKNRDSLSMRHKDIKDKIKKILKNCKKIIKKK